MFWKSKREREREAVILSAEYLKAWCEAYGLPLKPEVVSRLKAIKARTKYLPDPHAHVKLQAERHLSAALTTYFTGLQDRIAAWAVTRQGIKSIPAAQFWAGEDKTLLAILGPQLTRMAYSGASIAAEKAGIAFDTSLANKAAADWAGEYTDTLLQQLGTTTQDGIGPIVEDWINTDGATMGDLFQSLMDTKLMGADRASLIATTETTRAFAQGEIKQYSAMGITRMRWQTNNDEVVCDICEPLNGEVRTIGDDYSDGITEPPGHVNCRCWLTPVVGEKHIKVAGEGISDFSLFLSQKAVAEEDAEFMNIGKDALPPQLAEDPNDANAEWLKDNDPRLSVFMTGADPQGNEITAYVVDEEAIKDNVWQDYTDGMNHSRAGWVPDGEYWIASNLKPKSKKVTLVHETSEDRDLGGKSTEAQYDDAHEYTANPDEFEARHGPRSVDDILKEQGWQVE